VHLMEFLMKSRAERGGGAGRVPVGGLLT
jgi:hypothetical protein